ncbi:MAG TPA: hypothetical protein VFK18_06660 [Luteimonas sp.]|nr:hypothetical protein [Luteimonas sp.]
MNANEVIESYVRDVARLLPRVKRNDVALELRALLHDELAAKAEAQGRQPDRVLAMELLAGFGRPAEVAARYQPRHPLIAPEDNHNFAIWTVVGILALSVAGHDSGADLRWLEAMHWVGIMFVVFALIGWARRRQPVGAFSWRPRTQDKPARGGRWTALLAAMSLAVFPLAVYLSPQAYWSIATLGRGIPGGLLQTPEFLESWQRAATIVWFVLVLANYLAVAVRNGWTRWNRKLDIAGHLGLGLMLLAHAVPLVTWLDREPFAIFVAAGADAVARPWFGFAGALTIGCALYDLYREWVRVEPAPASVGATASA